MINRKLLRESVERLDSGGAFAFRIQAETWTLLVAEEPVTELSNEQLDYLIRNAPDYCQLDEVGQMSLAHLVRPEVRQALVHMLVTPSILTNLDAATAEIIMGWTRIADQDPCGCLTYVSANGTNIYVLKDRAIQCAIHTIWSPSTNLTAAQELFEKTFYCSDGRHLAATNIRSSGTTRISNSSPAISVENAISGLSIIGFRNASRTESFEISDDINIPPAAICVAALRLAGVNVQSS